MWTTLMPEQMLQCIFHFDVFFICFFFFKFITALMFSTTVLSNCKHFGCLEMGRGVPVLEVYIYIFFSSMLEFIYCYEDGWLYFLVPPGASVAGAGGHWGACRLLLSVLRGAPVMPFPIFKIWLYLFLVFFSKFVWICYYLYCQILVLNLLFEMAAKYSVKCCWFKLCFFSGICQSQFSLVMGFYVDAKLHETY